MTVDIDTNDPAVRRLMGLEKGAQLEFARDVERPREKELVHLAGDPDTGLSNTISLDHQKHEMYVLYRGKYTPPAYPDGLRLTVDVYELPNEPLCVHLICPKCRHSLRITSDRKQIEFERGTSPENGKLSIAPFQCTWEMPEAGEHHVPGLFGGGLSLCQWKGVLEHSHGRNIARDA